MLDQVVRRSTIDKRFLSCFNLWFLNFIVFRSKKFSLLPLFQSLTEISNMAISAKKLIKMARKWRRIAAIGRKRISFRGTTTVVDKGHFVVYTTDEKRFVFPIEYLNSYVFRELLILSEEEFGLPSNGPITLPCDAVFMDYAISLMSNGAGEDIQNALVIMSVANRCSSSYSLHQRGLMELQQPLICGF